MNTQGLLTPQPDKKKKTTNQRRSESLQSLNMPDITDKLFEEIIKDPVRKKLVMKLIEKEKDAIEEYKRKEANDKLKQVQINSPFRKIQRKFQCESPTALLRRRALEQQTRNSPSDTSSELLSKSSSSSACSSPVAFNKLLDGVVAYVEVRSKDQDRSAGAKVVMRNMGATIREQFTKDVTHVIFKDGSFSTYQKAKLMKIYLVSVLWLEAVRRNCCRVSEKNYPALGTEVFDQNVSMICSQMQKDYEDVIRDEIRRSLANGSLPTTKSIIENKTRLTPINSSSVRFSEDTFNDEEVEQITSNQKKTFGSAESPSSAVLEADSPLLTSDESDCGGMINGSIVGNKKDLFKEFNTSALEAIQKIPAFTGSNINLTGDQLLDLFNESSNVSSEESKSLLSNVSKSRKSSRKSNKTVDMSLTNLEDSFIDKSGNEIDDDENGLYKRRTNQLDAMFKKPSDVANHSIYKRRTQQFKTPSPRNSTSTGASSSKSTNISEDSFSTRLPTNRKRYSSLVSSSMSSLQLSNQEDIQILSKNCCKTNSRATRSSSSMSSLRLSSDKSKETHSSNFLFVNMSSVQLIEKGKENAQTSALSKEEENANNNSAGTTNSISPVKVLEDNITKRRRVARKCSSVCSSPLKSIENATILKESAFNSSKGEDLIGDKKGKGKRKTIAVDDSSDNVSTSETPKKSGKNTDSASGGSSSESAVKPKRLRKLYNPNDSIKDEISCDNAEREDKRLQAKKIKSNEAANGQVVTATASNIFGMAGEILNATTSASDDEDLQTKQEKKTCGKATKGKLDKAAKSTQVISDDDEQVGLASEFANKRTSQRIAMNTKVESAAPIRRRSVRLSSQCRKNLNEDALFNRGSLIPISPIVNRRSTMEFQSTSKQLLKKKIKIGIDKQSSIVCTKMHKSDIQLFTQIVKKIGGFQIEDEVSKKTTHLIAGESKRTINMLRGIAMGCWILRPGWLYKSLEEGKWLEEEDYEVNDFSKAVQQCRLQRQAFGPSFSMDIFQNCGYIFVALSSIPRCSDLRELVVMCKGQVVKLLRSAVIVVGEYVQQEGVTCVKETWILDSITFNKTMPFRKYLLKNTACNSPIV